MKLYGRTTSFNVQKVLWLLEELAVPYEHIELGGRFGGLDSPEFSRLNPMRKVPVLVDGKKVVWESHTILRYLAASYGRPAWYSDNPYQRSLYERWMDWAQVTFQPAFMGTFWGFYRMPPNKRDMGAINSDLQKCSQCLDVIEHQLMDNDYIAGPAITLADISVGSVLYRLTSQGLKVELPPRVMNWYEKLKQRPGYHKWVMSDFSELKSREAY